MNNHLPVAIVGDDNLFFSTIHHQLYTKVIGKKYNINSTDLNEIMLMKIRHMKSLSNNNNTNNIKEEEDNNSNTTNRPNITIQQLINEYVYNKIKNKIESTSDKNGIILKTNTIDSVYHKQCIKHDEILAPINYLNGYMLVNLSIQVQYYLPLESQHIIMKVTNLCSIGIEGYLYPIIDTNEYKLLNNEDKCYLYGDTNIPSICLPSPNNQDIFIKTKKHFYQNRNQCNINYCLPKNRLIPSEKLQNTQINDLLIVCVEGCILEQYQKHYLILVSYVKNLNANKRGNFLE